MHFKEIYKFHKQINREFLGLKSEFFVVFFLHELKHIGKFSNLH